MTSRVVETLKQVELRSRENRGQGGGKKYRQGSVGRPQGKLRAGIPLRRRRGAIEGGRRSLRLAVRPAVDSPDVVVLVPRARQPRAARQRVPGGRALNADALRRSAQLVNRAIGVEVGAVACATSGRGRRALIHGWGWRASEQEWLARRLQGVEGQAFRRARRTAAVRHGAAAGRSWEVPPPVGPRRRHEALPAFTCAMARSVASAARRSATRARVMGGVC